MVQNPIIYYGISNVARSKGYLVRFYKVKNKKKYK
jgi:hypothetical protein